MRRLIPLLAVLSLGATYYVDGSCGNNGDGTTGSCAGSPGGVGAKNDLASGISLLSSAGDVLNVKAGTYRADQFTISGKNGSSGNPIIVQANGWAGLGTGERVLLESAAGVTWNACSWDGSACDCGAASLNQAIANGSTGCGETYYFSTGSGPTSVCVGASNADGTPTFRVANAGAMTNAHTYLSGRCSGETYRPCSVNGDCLNSETCTASATPEHDSACVGADLLVRWGSAPGSSQRVYTSDNAVRLQINSSSWLTVRGITTLGGRRQGFNVGQDSTNIVLDDNRSLFSFDNGNGSGYGIWLDESTPVSFTNGEIGWSGDEGIHTTAACKAADCTGSGAPCSCCTGAGAGANCRGATAFTISGTWIHDMGDPAVLGLTSIQTPTAFICSQIKEAAHSAGPGDYTGSVFSGNVVQRTNGGSSAGRGLIFESNCSNWTVRDNIFDSINASCLKFNPADAAGQAASNNTIFNNILSACGTSCFEFNAAATMVASGNTVYNNTCRSPVGNGIDLTSCSGTCQNNIFRNNIFQALSLSARVVNSTNTDVTNLLEYSDIKNNGTDPVLKWQNTDRNCATVSSAGAGNICSDAVFVNSSDHHIQTSSPAKNAGTATGMPSARTTDISNTIASTHGFPNYADGNAIQGGTWDMGADEFLGGAGAAHRVMVISRLDGGVCE